MKGVGVFLTRGFCTGSTWQRFLPCTVVSSVCAYETICKVYKRFLPCTVVSSVCAYETVCKVYKRFLPCTVVYSGAYETL